jgi:hypothetical protein
VSFAEARIPSWADPEPSASSDDVLRTVTAVSFLPQCTNRDASGQLPPGTLDSGAVDVDDVELF